MILAGGPSRLAGVRLKQVKPELSVSLPEKGVAMLAHAMSGRTMEPGPLYSLLPNRRRSHAADRCGRPRAPQRLRHKGPLWPDHLGDARGQRRPQLRQRVKHQDP